MVVASKKVVVSENDGLPQLGGRGNTAQVASVASRFSFIYNCHLKGTTTDPGHADRCGPDHSAGNGEG